MKRNLCTWTLFAAMLLFLTVPASAAGSAAGFYNVGTGANVTIQPSDAAGAVQADTRDVDGTGGAERFYPGSDRLAVTLSGTQKGEQYILTVSLPKDGTVCFVDQQGGGGTITFDVIFALPVQQAEMLLSIGSSARGFVKVTVPLSYTPSAAEEAPSPGPEPAPEYADCPRDGTCPMALYADLVRSAWYHDGIHWALDEGVMNGTGEDSFAPGTGTSRAMLVTMLWRLEGEPVVNFAMTFTDVEPDSWYTEAVRWAAAGTLVGGYSDEAFGPGDAVSREQLAAILCRYAGYQGADTTAGIVDHLGQYVDAEKISSWALESLRWAVHTGLVTGTDDEHLSPRANASRAQVATMLMRYTAQGA